MNLASTVNRMVPQNPALVRYSIEQLESMRSRLRDSLDQSRKQDLELCPSCIAKLKVQGIEKKISDLDFKLSLRQKIVELQNELSPKGKKSAAATADVSLQAKMDELEKELSKLVGLNDLKAQIWRWAKGMLLDERRRALGLGVGMVRPPHMVFLSNPGTGKTTVARILRKLVHAVGILPTDRVTEVQRTDLVAEYMGQTGPKTRKKIEEAKGGILFVDEAYRLVVKRTSGFRDLGIEALEEIMSVMESGSIMVIFAGYREPMDQVISSNEGFRRRVTKIFHFDDFSSDDLAKILHIKMRNQEIDSPLHGFKLHHLCGEETVAALIQRETTEKQRSEMNGGLVYIMLTNARENLDSRLDLNCADMEEIRTLTLQDLEAGLRRLPN